MLIEDGTPQSIIQKITAFLLRSIPIENSKPSKILTALICLHYAFDYVILWALNANLLNSQTPPLSLTLPFFIARLVTSIAFIVSKMPLFFLLNKTTIAVQLLIASRQPLYLQVVNIMLEIMMCGVWTLSKQQRMVHFDSRMGLRRAFMKQVSIYGALLGSNPQFYEAGSREVIFLLTVKILVVWWIDSTEFYYNSNTKRYFIRLDQMMTVLFIATLLNDFLGITYQEYLFVSAALLLILFVHILSPPQNQGSLLTTPLSTLSNNNEMVIAEYFLEIKTMLQTQSHQHLQSFVMKMQQQLQHVKFQQKLTSAKTQGIDIQRQVINEYIIKELKRYSQHSSLLKDLLLYMYLPDRRVYSYLDLKNCHHRREYQRILSQKSVQFVNESYEANRQLQQAKSRLFTCSDISRRLYRQLVKERINLQRVLELGAQHLSILYMFISQNAASFQRSQKVSLLIFKYSQLCLSLYFAQKMKENSNSNGTSQQKEAQVIIGTEEEKAGIIVHLNLGFMKLASLTRRASHKMSFSTVIPKEFEAFIQDLMNNQSKSQLAGKEEVKAQYAWIENSLENVVCCSWLIKQTFYESQRCLELSLSPIYVQKAILIIDESGIILGASQLARYYGFSCNSKSMKLNQVLIVQLLQNGGICIMQGANLDNNQLYFAQFGFSLQLLNTLQTPFCQNKVYVIQLLKQQKKDLVKTGTFKLEKNPIEFEFHFNWSGKITNQRLDDDLPVWSEKTSRIRINYSDNITEMRFFRQNIDYKSNFERDEDHDCPSLPRQLQENLPNINEEQFYQKWSRKRESTPTWLKIAVFVIIITVIASIGLLAMLLINFNQFALLQNSTLTYVSKLYQKLQATIKLGTLTTFAQLGLPQNSTQLISSQIALSSTLSTDLYTMNPNAFTQFGGQSLLLQLNILNLHINNYLQNTAAATRNALNMLTQIIPNYYGYVDALITSNKDQISSNSSLGILLVAVFAVVIGLFIFLLWFLQYRLNQQQNEIVDVLKSLDNDFLLVASIKAQKFKEIWLQENDLPEYEPDQAVTDQQKHNYSKHTTSSFNLHSIKLFQVLWFVAMVLLLLLIRNFGQQLNNTAIQYTSLTTHTFKHITALHQTWTLFNINSTQATLNTQISFTFNQEYKKILILREIAVNPLASLGPFYLGFWQREDFCKYMSSPDCNTLLGLGTSQGANVVLSFLSQQYDSYLNFLSNTSLIYSQPDVQKLGKIVYFYLDQSIDANLGGILGDFSKILNKLWMSVFIAFAFSLLNALLFSLFALYYSRLHNDHQRHQEILMLIPFDKLKTLPAFHRFYNKRFSSA